MNTTAEIIAEKRQLLKWSEEDKIILLKALIEKGDQGNNIDDFYEYIKKILHTEFSLTQVREKMRKMKKTFVKSENIFILSQKIWGANRVENINQSSAINVPEATALVGEIPFLKSSSLWKEIESREVFRSFPQNPHFKPLIECKEASREGFAIGQMLTFATLIEKISKLQVDDCREVFYDCLKALTDLETHGFKVEQVVDRLKKLLSIKDQIAIGNDEFVSITSAILKGN